MNTTSCSGALPDHGNRAHLDVLLHWYATLTPHNVAQLVACYAADAHFKDPFNDVRGTQAISRIFEHMFEVTTAPRFVMGERLLDGNQAFVTWVFHFSLRGRQYSITGASHLYFNGDGRVREHRDYWDAAEELLEKLPLIGAPVRWLRRAFSVPQSAGNNGNA